jgi:hypothetical protein
MANPGNKKEKWDLYLAKVPGLDAAIQKQEFVDDDSVVDYRNFTAKLPETVSQQMVELKAEDYEKLLPKKIEHRWCLCDMPEGDFPRIFSYTSLANLTEAIAKREGKETAVWAMYGVPLMLSKALTRGSGEEKEIYRYLLLPDKQAVIVANKEPFRLIDQDDLPEDLEMENDGWLGDPTFLQSSDYFMPKNIHNDQLSADPETDEDNADGEEPGE